MRRAALLLALAVAGVLPAHAHLGSHEVRVRDGFFEPQELRIDPGETVTWNALASGHTVTADDERFDFPGSRLTREGDRFQWTFTENETVGFFCRVHRGSMFGIIVVGSGTPPPPPSTDPPEVRGVPIPYPTIAAALDGAPSGTVIELAPGAYHESASLDVPGVELRGTGASPADVRIEGGSVRGIGVNVLAPGVRIRNLTVRRATFAGIAVGATTDVEIEDVVVEDNDHYGIRMVGARGAAIRGVSASGAGRAGIAIEACDPCDAIVDRSTATRNLIGVAATGARGLVVRSSTIRGNGAGIVLRSTAAPQAGAQAGAHVVDNLIEDNTFRPHRRPREAAPLEIPAGVGVWIASGAQNLIERNTIAGHLYNVAVTGLEGPSVADTIRSNVVVGAIRADLAWDGIGLGVCFAGNRGSGREQPSSEPPMIETLSPCSAVPAPGVPYPLVAAQILLYGAG